MAHPSKKSKKSPKKRPSAIPMRLTERDEKIIVQCFEDKLLSTSHLKRLYFPSHPSCSRRLRILYSNHYLDRSFFPASPPSMGKKEAYYSLGKKGVGLVALSSGSSQKQIKSQRRALKRQIRSYSILFTLAHINTISWTRFAIESAMRVNDKVEITNWTPERLLQQRFKGDGKRLKLTPDALMQYRIKPLDKTYTAFLEIDLGTESRKQIQKKTERYLAFSETSLLEERFGTRWFRVIILTTSEERSKNMKSAVESVIDKIFWVTDYSKLKGSFLEKNIFLRAGLHGRYPLIEG